MNFEEIANTEKALYHITDTAKHKAAVLNGFANLCNNYRKDEVSFINLLFNVSTDTDPLNIIESDNTVLQAILGNTQKFLELRYGYDKKEITKELSLRYMAIRIQEHDESKIGNIEEYEMYKNVVYKLSGLQYGTPEHKAAIQELNKGFELHAAANSHHPEFYTGKESIYDKKLLNILEMNLFDFIEMIIDWCAAAICRGFKFKLSTIDAKKNDLQLSDGIIDIIKKNIVLILDPIYIDNN